MKNLTEKKFGRLIVIKPIKKNKGGLYIWLCKCDCGNTVEIVGTNLSSGNTQSCGCLQREIIRDRNFKHGMRNFPEYRIWAGIKTRCLNKKEKDYKNYGGREILICKRWLNSFENFYKDMGDRPRGTSIDRINNNGNYCPENCRWITKKEQNLNKRNNKMITYKGETKCLSKWAEKFNINYFLLWKRLNRGWDINKIFNKSIIEKI